MLTTVLAYITCYLTIGFVVAHAPVLSGDIHPTDNESPLLIALCIVGWPIALLFFSLILIVYITKKYMIWLYKLGEKFRERGQ